MFCPNGLLVFNCEESDAFMTTGHMVNDAGSYWQGRVQDYFLLFPGECGYSIKSNLPKRLDNTILKVRYGGNLFKDYECIFNHSLSQLGLKLYRVEEKNKQIRIKEISEKAKGDPFSNGGFSKSDEKYNFNNVNFSNVGVQLSKDYNIVFETYGFQLAQQRVSFQLHLGSNATTEDIYTKLNHAGIICEIIDADFYLEVVDDR